jgi:phenylalanyl-tRNA synthetase alpha chain
MSIMDIKKLESEIKAELAKIKTDAEAGAFHQKYLSKSGVVSGLMVDLRNMPGDQRAAAGAAINALKRETEEQLFSLQRAIKENEINEKLNNDKLVDITLPNACVCVGNEKGALHPITRVSMEVEEVFRSMGFIVERGDEVATEFENFDSLNIPKNHPARDMQDTFWLSNGQVLKTHTSAVQNRLLKTYGPEFRAIFPGRCFRNEAVDASHENTFFQLEGMMVGEDVSVANLIYFMKSMLSAVFKKDIQVRLRPGYFSFVEPGFELDASCVFCDGKGCQTCKQGGWIELCPCGMIHPKVLEMGGVDPKKYQGFAFGLGLTRLAMIKYGIREIRHFNSTNVEFLREVK